MNIVSETIVNRVAAASMDERELFPGVSFEDQVPTNLGAEPRSPRSRQRSKPPRPRHDNSTIHTRRHVPPPPPVARVSSPDENAFNRLFQEWRAGRLASKRAHAAMLAKREQALTDLAETVAELRLHPVRRTTTPTASSPLATKLSPNRHQVRLPIVNTASMSALERSIVKSNTSLVASELALSIKSRKNEQRAAEIRERVAAEMREECDRIMHRKSWTVRPRFGQQVNAIPTKPSPDELHRIDKLLPVLADEIPKLLAPRPCTPPSPIMNGDGKKAKAVPVPIAYRFNQQEACRAKNADFPDLEFSPPVIKLTAYQATTTITIAQKSLVATRVHWLPIPLEHDRHLKITPIGHEPTRWCRTLPTGHHMDAKITLKKPHELQPDTRLYVLVEINGSTVEWPVLVDADQCSLHVPRTSTIVVSPTALDHSVEVVNRGMGYGKVVIELEDELNAILIQPESEQIQLGAGDAAQVSFRVDPRRVLDGLDALVRMQGTLGSIHIKSGLSGALVAKVPVAVSGFARPLEWVQGSTFAFHPSPSACPVQKTFMLRNPNPWPERYTLKLRQLDTVIDVQLTPHQGSISAHSEVPIRIAISAVSPSGSGNSNLGATQDGRPLEFETCVVCSTKPAGSASVQLTGLFFTPRLEVSHQLILLPQRMLTGDQHSVAVTLTNPLPVAQLVGMDSQANVSFSLLTTADHLLLEPGSSVSGTLCFSALSAGKVATQVVFRGLVPSGPVTSTTVSITGNVHQPIAQLSANKVELGLAAPGSISSSTVELSWTFNERERAGKEHRTQDMATFIVGSDPTTVPATTSAAEPASAAASNGGSLSPVSAGLRPKSPPGAQAQGRPRSGSTARPKSPTRSTLNLAATTPSEAVTVSPLAVQVVRVEGPVSEILSGTNASATTAAPPSVGGADQPSMDLTRLLHIQNGHGQLQPQKRPTVSVTFLFVPPKVLPQPKNSAANANLDGSTDQPSQPGSGNSPQGSTQPLPARGGSRMATDGSKSLAPPQGDGLQASTNGKRAGSASKNRAKAGASSAALTASARSGAATANTAAGSAANSGAVSATGPQPPPDLPAGGVSPMLSATITYRVPVMIFLTHRHGSSAYNPKARFLSEDTRLDWTLQHIDVTCTLTSPIMSIHMPPTVDFGPVAMGCVATTKLRLLNHHRTQHLTPELTIPAPFRLSKAVRPIPPLSHGDVCLALDSTSLAPPLPISGDGTLVTRKLSLHSHGTRTAVLLSGTVYAPQLSWTVGDDSSPLMVPPSDPASPECSSSSIVPITHTWELGDIYFGDSPSRTLTVSNATAFAVPIRKSSCSTPALTVVWQPSDVIPAKSSATVTLTLSLPPPSNLTPDASVIGQPQTATARIECQGSVLHVVVTWTPWLHGLNLLGLPLTMTIALPPLTASATARASSPSLATSDTPVPVPAAPVPTATLSLHLLWTRVATLGRGFARQAVYAVTWPRGLYALHVRPGAIVPAAHGKAEGKPGAAGKGGGADKHGAGAHGGVHASIAFGEFQMPGTRKDVDRSVTTAPSAASSEAMGQQVQQPMQHDATSPLSSRPTSPTSGQPTAASPASSPPVAAVESAPVTVTTSVSQPSPAHPSHHPHTTPPIPTHLLVPTLFSSLTRTSCIAVPVGQPTPIEFAFNSTEYITVLNPPTPTDPDSVPAKFIGIANVPPTATLVAIPWNKPVPDLTGAFMDMVLSGGYDAETRRMAAGGDAGRIVRVVLSMSVVDGRLGVPRAGDEVDWTKVLEAWEAERSDKK